MRVRVQSMALVATTLACCACGGNAAPPAASSTPPSSTAATASATPEFGVAECDDYVKKYLACLDRMAPEARTLARGAFDQTREPGRVRGRARHDVQGGVRRRRSGDARAGLLVVIDFCASEPLRL
jgi:hypothetical protein